MSNLSELTPGTWTIDPAHSTVGFVARHLMVTKVRGRFTDFSGTITIADDPLQSSVEAIVQLESVSTGDAGRDGHLKGADFFDTDFHKTMEFRSTSIRQNGSDYVLNGDLTIKGVTKPVSFELEFDGVNADPWGNTKVGFTAETEINRKDWGLEWNVALEAGGVVVSDKVRLHIDAEAVLQR